MAQETPARPRVPRYHGNASASLPPAAIEALARAMVVRHLDNSKLARRSELAVGTIANIRAGKRVRIEVLERVAEALESTPRDELLVRLFRGEVV